MKAKETATDLRLQRLILDYEVRSSVIATRLPFRWMQAIAAVFITRKAARKYQRWMRSLAINDVMESIKKAQDENSTPRNP